MTASPNFNPANYALLCSNYKGGEKYEACVEWTINSLMASTYTYAPQAIEFCNTQDAPGKKTCFTKLGNDLSVLAPEDEVDKFCEKVGKEYQHLCLNESAE
jgi:hypothetical protein